MEKKYYIAIDGQLKGPYTPEELSSHGLTHSSRIFAKGWTELRSAAEIPELEAVLSYIPENKADEKVPEDTDTEILRQILGHLEDLKRENRVLREKVDRLEGDKEKIAETSSAKENIRAKTETEKVTDEQWKELWNQNKETEAKKSENKKVTDEQWDEWWNQNKETEAKKSEGKKEDSGKSCAKKIVIIFLLFIIIAIFFLFASSNSCSRRYPDEAGDSEYWEPAVVEVPAEATVEATDSERAVEATCEEVEAAPATEEAAEQAVVEEYDYVDAPK